MTHRAQEVTVPIHDLTTAPSPPRSIPVQGTEAGNTGSTELPIGRKGEDEAAA
jgi:hypothetical protein